ncbi:MAG: hypothetical protein HZA68_09840 [Rhodovulum sp.]|nr:hypothetical protein [Rhodovulum sp.]
MRRLLHWLFRSLPVLLMVIAWEAAVRLGLVGEALLPPPSEVAAAWWRLAAAGDLLPHAAASLWRATAGLAISVAAGVALGLAMALSRTAERLVQPLITFLYPLPKSALIPIVLVWFGFGHGAQIAVIVLGCLLPVVLGAYNGARGVEPALVWSARSLGHAAPRSSATSWCARRCPTSWPASGWRWRSASCCWSRPRWSGRAAASAS